MAANLQFCTSTVLFIQRWVAKSSGIRLFPFREIIQENNIHGFFDLICSETYKHMRKHSEEKVPIDVILFDFEGKILARKSEQ